MDLLSSSDEWVRWKVVMLLGIRRPMQDDGGALIERLRCETDEMVIHALLSAMGNLYRFDALRPRAVAELIRIASDPVMATSLRNNAFLSLCHAEGRMSDAEYSRLSIAQDDDTGTLLFNPSDVVESVQARGRG